MQHPSADTLSDDVCPKLTRLVWCLKRTALLQGFFVFIRAVQLLTASNQGVVVVSP